MKFVWEADDIRPGRKAHCASGTYLIVAADEKSDPDFTLVNIEFNHVHRIGVNYYRSVRASIMADELTALGAWPDGVMRDGTLRDA